MSKVPTDFTAHPGKFVIWAVGGTQDPLLRRAAYLRIIAVRDMLMAKGIAANRIETRIINGTTARTSGQMVYVLQESAVRAQRSE